MNARRPSTSSGVHQLRLRLERGEVGSAITTLARLRLRIRIRLRQEGEGVGSARNITA